MVHTDPKSLFVSFGRAHPYLRYIFRLNVREKARPACDLCLGITDAHLKGSGASSLAVGYPLARGERCMITELFAAWPGQVTAMSLELQYESQA
jgi:hypothetical protein